MLTRENRFFFSFFLFFHSVNAKYCICHFLFCSLYVEPVQTGYPWQPFYNASRNTLEEVPFYLGWRAGTEAAENQMRGQKWRLTGLYTGYFLFIWRLWKAPPQKGWLAKKKKKTAHWENNENSSERPEKKKKNDLSVFYSTAKCSIGHSEILILQILISFFFGWPMRERCQHCMWVSETFWHWHSLYRRARSLGPVGSSHVEYSRRVHDGRGVVGGGTQPAGSSAGLSPSPCQELTGPIREERRPHPCMLISPVRGARVEGNCRGSLPWIQQQQQSHSITWAGKPGGRNAASWRRRHEARWPSVTSRLLRTVKGWS